MFAGGLLESQLGVVLVGKRGFYGGFRNGLKIGMLGKGKVKMLG